MTRPNNNNGGSSELSACKIAIENGDALQAIEHYAQFQTTLPDAPAELLATFQQAVRNDDAERAAGVLQEYRQTILPDRSTDRAVALSRAGRAVGDLDLETAASVQRQLIDLSTVRDLRSSFLPLGAAYLDDAVDRSETVVLDAAGSLRDREQTAVEARTAIEETVAMVELPAYLTTEAVPLIDLPVGGSTSVEVTVRNIGDHPAMDVEVEIQTTKGITASPTSRTLGELLGKQARTASFTISLADRVPQKAAIIITLSAEEASTASHRIAIDISETRLGRFDKNENGRIDIQEILAAIAAFINNADIGGQGVALGDIARLIVAYINERAV